MYSYSKTSQSRKGTCHPLIQEWLDEVIKYVDCTIACGYREKTEQNLCFESGASNVKWPDSNHNKIPSLAVDVYPFVNGRMVNGDEEGDNDIIIHFAGILKGIALVKGYPIRWGGDWKGFKGDYPHWEIYISV